MTERGQPSSSCLGLAKRSRRMQQRAVDYFSSQVLLRKDMALFMLIDYQSRNSLVGRDHSGSGRWRDLAAGKQLWVGRGAVVLGLGPCASDGLFLGMWFVPQEPVYLHNRLRGQLAQHLEENGVVGSLKKGMEFEGMNLEEPEEQHRGPSGRERVKAVPVLPCHPRAAHVQSEDLVVSDLTGPFWVGQ